MKTVPQINADKLTPFDAYAWESFAGSEEFPNGDEPLIGHYEDGSIIIIDAMGYLFMPPIPEDFNDYQIGEEIDSDARCWSADCARIYLKLKGILV